ncbi:MAG: lytic polysaccharide monooxygenase [Actinomycetia bacterium]|nr:lytic polysaccharide monooxygenase [Actinomycetes bacterium]
MDLALGRCKRMWAFALSAILVGGLLIALPLASPEAKAHGSLSDPPSRTYTCRFIAPEDPMCQQAWDADPQALYDWMEVNIGDAASRHQELIPDGRLCSANRDKYAAFDTANSQWRATPLTADADGKYTFTWESTAPHATRYYKLYLTNASYDPNQPLAWDDLELVYDSGDRPGEFEAELRTELPDRTGHHILYTVWQRSDSPEAFYSCSDVLLGGATTPTPTPSVSPSATVTSSPTPTPIEPTPTSPTATPHPTHTPPNPDTDNADLKLVTTADWGSGYCAEGKVTTTSTAPVSWEVSFDLHGEMTSAWSADITMGADHRYRATGHSWNATVKKGSPTSFGFCMDHGSHNPPAPHPNSNPHSDAEPYAERDRHANTNGF